MTNGTQQAIDLVARVAARAGRRVAVEDPGYPPVRLLLASLGARVVPVPVDDEGIGRRLPARRRSPRVVTPSHQFPLGMRCRCDAGSRCSTGRSEHDAAIVEDDYDSEFRFDGRPIESLQSLDPPDGCSMSGPSRRRMLPTLRLGFVVAPGAFRHAVQAAKFVSDWHTAIPTQRALAAFIGEGWFARHLRRMRPIYRERHLRIAEILARDFANELRAVPAAAGLHVCAVATEMTVEDVERAMGRAADAGVAMHALATMAAAPPGRPGLLLGYGAIATEHIDEGMRRLRAAFG